MKTKKLRLVTLVRPLIVIIIMFGFTECKPVEEKKEMTWQVVPLVKNVIRVPCNDDTIAYHNISEYEVLLRFDVESACEFSGKVEKLNERDSSLAFREVKGYASGQQQKIEASFEMKPGEKFYVNCQHGITVDDPGCKVTWWVVAERK